MLVLSRCAIVCRFAAAAFLIGSGLAGSVVAAELPAHAFFRDPFLTQITISPDGSRLAALITRGAKETLIVRGLSDTEPIPVARNEELGWRIAQLRWVNEKRLIFSLETRGYWSGGKRRRATQLWAADRDGARKQHLGATWPVQEFSQFQSNWIGPLRDEADRVLVNYVDETRTGVTPRALEVDGGVVHAPLDTRSGAERWLADRFGRVRAAVAGGARSAHYELHARIDSDSASKTLSNFDPYRESGLFFGAFAEDPTQLYVIRTEVGGRSTAHRYDLAAGLLGAQEFGHPEVDVAGIALDHQGRAVGVDYILDGFERHYFDTAAEKEQRGLDAALPATTNRIISASADGKKKLIEVSSSKVAPSYYLLDRETMSLEMLFSAFPELEGVALAETRALRFNARNGLLLHAYLTTPAPSGTRPPPTIVLTLDRPEGRALMSFQPLVQFLANRGFAVLQVNHRGSRGYGRSFEAAGIGEWGRGIQDDLEDAVGWLASQGLVDASRVGIFGQGFGGYTALMAAVRRPGFFRACASYGAATDLSTLLRDNQNQGEPWGGDLERTAGSWSDRAQLVALSPYDQLEKVSVPILLGHGAQDSSIDAKHSKRMHRALQDAGKPSQLELYPDEHDAIDFEANRVEFHEKLAAFFEQHLTVGATTPGSR